MAGMEPEAPRGKGDEPPGSPGPQPGTLEWAILKPTTPALPLASPLWSQSAVRNPPHLRATRDPLPHSRTARGRTRASRRCGLLATLPNFPGAGRDLRPRAAA